MRGGRRSGAGRPRQRALTCQTELIDLRELIRRGRVGRSCRGFNISYPYQFSEGWRDIQEFLPVEWEPCRFGGKRPFFLCPRCSRRCLTIYLYGYPACRCCSCLAYPSQLEDALDRAWRRVRTLQDRLGWQDGKIGPKPKGMRTRTFGSLADAIFRERHRKDELSFALMVGRLRSWGFTDM